MHEHLDRAEYSIEEKREAFEKLSQRHWTEMQRLPKMFILKSDYMIAVCAYAEAMIQKEEV